MSTGWLRALGLHAVDCVSTFGYSRGREGGLSQLTSQSGSVWRAPTTVPIESSRGHSLCEMVPKGYVIVTLVHRWSPLLLVLAASTPHAEEVAEC